MYNKNKENRFIEEMSHQDLRYTITNDVQIILESTLHHLVIESLLYYPKINVINYLRNCKIKKTVV